MILKQQSNSVVVKLNLKIGVNTLMMKITALNLAFNQIVPVVKEEFILKSENMSVLKNVMMMILTCVMKNVMIILTG